MILFLLTVSLHAQSIEDARQDYLRGNFDKVIKIAEKKAEDGDYRGDWRILLVKTLLTTGRYTEARTNALAAVADYAGGVEMRLLARETLLYSGDRQGADRQLNEIKSLIERRGGSFESEDAPPLGEALLLLGLEPRLVLENCFRRAEKMEPPIRDAFLDAGQLA
ncbi:MAG TPA: hypothetical protein VHZ30_06315, partial [Verrucomicrobiae bacterium]|nr:hypothetical protein [Verrucomicrobiae bacterium]